MAIVRRTEGQSPVVRSEWSPFRLMEDLLRWEPFRGGTWEPFRHLVGPTFAEHIFTPQFEVKETKDGYVIRADLPGVKESDLDISLTGSLLTISGKREQEDREEGESFYAYERSYGNFTRSFTLPESADTEHVKAELKGGVLTLALPKKAELQAKRISVKSGGGPEKGKA
jgi:HSP20 family protein